MKEKVEILWEGSWQEAEIIENFRDQEVVAKLCRSGEEIVVPIPRPTISAEERLASLRAAGEIFHLEFLLAGSEDILRAPLRLH